MLLRLRSVSVYACALLMVFACGGESKNDGAPTGNGGVDANGDNVPDDIGKLVDANMDGKADQIDVNGDGVPDGWAIDTNGDGVADGLLFDTDCDGIFESYDANKDGIPEWHSTAVPPKTPPAGCKLPPLSGAGGSGGTGGSGGSGMAGTPSSGGTPGTAGTPSTGGGGGGTVDSQLGKGAYQGTGTTTDRYWEQDVGRNGIGYKFIANGWGDGFQSHNISYNGTSFTVTSFSGSPAGQGVPAGFPTVFCGYYSEKQSPATKACGLPADVTSLKQVRTGMRWKANGNTSDYNTSWDIWIGSGGQLQSYLMVWLRDPPNQSPAGAAALSGVTIPGVPGTWKTVVGNVNNRPIVNYVAEGGEPAELEFDVLAFYNDAKMRNYNLPGSQILSVAAGFEIWSGPLSNLVLEDFYVDVRK